MENELADIFRNASTRRLQQFCGRIEACVAKLSDDEVWARGSESENAIGNLMLHLAGNLRQWIISGVGGQADNRHRDTEFDTRGGLSKDEMFLRLKNTVDETCAVIGKLTPAQMIERRRIQAYDVAVMEAVLHVVEHFAQHSAQITFATKMLTKEDMGFYRHLRASAPDAHTEKTP